MLIVQKFGGTSVGSLERIEKVSERVLKSVAEGHKVVVVVSAMSGETNKLISYAKHFSDSPTESEMDTLLSSGERVTSALLSIALNAKGQKATSLSGRGAGIVTDSNHTKARIESIDPKPIRSAIEDGNVVVVAGFQGIDEKSGRVTTLGRGGSDLSAVALAGAIEADLCEIYTDVDGIYTTDPRIEPKAKKLEVISYDEMLEMASLGAKVLQSRSVEMAKKLNVNLVTRSSFNENEGTLITNEDKIVEKPLVSGIALDKNQARVGLIGVVDRPGIASDIFKALADANINVDMIVQTVGHGNSDSEDLTNVAFTVSRDELESAKNCILKFKANNELQDIEVNDNIVKVSIVGVGMKSHTGVASKAFSTMANERINIMMISTSEIKVSMIIEEKYSELAVRSLHSAYELDK
jgi:aspartate kinase